MEFFKKKFNAWMITLITIILASVIGSGSSLNKFKNKTENIFYLGESKDGTGIQHDLEVIMSDSTNLTVVARRYIDKDHGLINAVSKSKETLNSAKTPGAKYREMQNLLISVTELYAYLGDLPLSEKDQNFRKSLYADINSRNIIISRNIYNQRAREFNRTLDYFPANILSNITFVSPLELFE
jgi:hypothetical protein